MPECQKIRVKHRQLCAGDLDKKIKIQNRSIATPSLTVDFGETFVDNKTVWAALKTSGGRASFYTTNLEVAITHIFYIRWFSGLNAAQNWVEWNSEKYDIVEVENIDERSEWAALYCNVRGDKDEPVNYA